MYQPKTFLRQPGLIMTLYEPVTSQKFLKIFLQKNFQKSSSPSSDHASPVPTLAHTF